jgi:hypothetical protein
MALFCTQTSGALPDPATGGKDGGPLELLIIKGHSEWNFGQQPDLDATYLTMLEDGGYRVTTIHEWQKLNSDFLRQFHTVVYLNPSACFGGGYFDHTGWRSGRHLLTVRENFETLREHVEAGGGLLLVPTFEEMGFRMTASLNQIFGTYGLRTACGCVRDETHHWVPPDKDGKPMKTGFVPVMYSWTERLAPHPISQGVRRVYYPSLCTRWDDNYTTMPLKPVDAAWKVVVRGMPGSTTEAFRSSIYDPSGNWTPLAEWNEPGIFVAREYGKGRVAVVSVSAWYLFYMTYSKHAQVTESNFGKFDGVAMSAGDGKTPSDLHILLDNAYRWLAEPSLKTGMGGYDPQSGIKLAKEDHSFDETFISDYWPITGKDPLATGPVRPMRVLVGARSAVSDGEATAAQWARAAKGAGYDVVCFTQKFEQLKHEQWEEFAADCREHSDEEVALLPGFDIDTDLRNRFLIVGHPQPMRTHILTPDRKKLFWTGHMMIAMGDVLPAAGRPGWLNTVRSDFGRLPPDLYSHISGIPIVTYAGEKLEQVDDGFFAYKWHVDNSTVPQPLAVHEVTSPGQLTLAAKTGLQNYVQSDTPANAAFYFRQGFTNYGGNPQRYYVSSGPHVDFYGIDDWRSPAWTVTLEAHSEHPIVEILVRDQLTTYRRFLPNTRKIKLKWHGALGRQRWFITEIRDANGGRAILSPLRTLPPFHYARCMDRQNFFGHRFEWLTYVGYMRPRFAFVEVPGVKLPSDICPKPQMFYAGNRYSILDFVLDSTQVPTGTHWDPARKQYAPGGRRYGADNAPLFNDLPIPEYWSRVRYICYRLRTDARLVGPPAYADAIVDIRLKKDLAARGDVWPIIARTATGGNYTYTDSTTGRKVVGKLEQGFVDLPEGGTVNEIVALTPLRVSAAGHIGFPPPPGGIAKAGTTRHGAFTLINAANAVHKSMGLDGPVPYALKLTQGKVDKIVGATHFRAQQGGVAGRLTGAAIPAWGPTTRAFHPQIVGVPIRLHDANPRWVAGLWTGTGQDSGKPGTIEQFGFLDGILLGVMLVDKDTDFFVGNLITATDPNLNLAFADEWTSNKVVIEVNNPTDRAVTAIVRTAKVIPDRKQVEQRVTVPAGSTVYVQR